MRRLLSYEYLLEPIPGPPGPLRPLYFLLALGTLVLVLFSIVLWRTQRTDTLRRALMVELVLASSAFALLACSFANLPRLSMRILLFGASLLAWLWPVAMYVGMLEPAPIQSSHRRAFAGQIDLARPSLPRYTSLLLLAAHWTGLLALCGHYGWPWWASVALLFGLLTPQLWFSLRQRRWQVGLEALAPLFLPYMMLCARLITLVVLKMRGYPHFALPHPWVSVLNVDLTVAIAFPWAFFAQVHSALRRQRREGALLPAMAAAGLLVCSVWAGYVYLHLRTRGVTGTDPYCYAQMAVDLAETGTPVHAFPLVARMEELGLLPEAGVHLGYHQPFHAAGRAATVWPLGQSALLAVGYRLAGEGGLYAVTPILGLLSLGALAALSSELLTNHLTADKIMVSALAVILLATSYAQIERLLVPMADAAAQLFSTLTVWLGLRAIRGRLSLLWALLAGLSFGMAYQVRHTQLVLALPILFCVWADRSERGKKLAWLACFGSASLLVALPDLVYHRWVMGHWLRPESLELRHFALQFVLPMAARMLREVLARNEFWYVSPFIVYGLWRQWREDSVGFGALATCLAAVLVIHLPYEALRLRDLLSLYPVLCFWAGYGIVAVGRRVQEARQDQRLPPFLRSFGYAILVVALLAVRTRSTWALAGVSDFDTFGYLNPFQRAGFAQIGQDTEATALIGASLNSGSIELHAERVAFRPAVWRAQELCIFVDDALSRRVPLYLLDDGLAMSSALAAARHRYNVELIGYYDIPYYHTGGGSAGGRVALYRIQSQGGGANHE